MSYPSLEQIAKFFQMAANGEITEELFKRFMENPHAATVPLSTLGALVAGARFDHVSDDINTDNFPLKGEFNPAKYHHLIWFNEKLSTQPVFSRLLNESLIPGEIEYLVDYTNASYLRHRRRGFSIVALGSTFVDEYGLVKCPYVYYNMAGGKELSTLPFENIYDKDCRFLVRPAV